MAYLVMAHGQLRLLGQLLSLLDDERNDIFLHLDAKLKDAPFEELSALVRHATLHFARERFDVRWGDCSQSMTELNLYAEAAAAGPYERYCLISGACLPLKSQDEIHAFFNAEERRGKNFLYVHPHYSQPAYERLSRYHFSARTPLVRFAKHILYCFPWIDRIRGRFPVFAFGYNWSCLTHEAVSYLLEKHDELKNLLRHTVCADEVYRQLYLMNHPTLRETIYRDAEGCTPNLWYVDWSAHVRHPAVLTMEYVPQLLDSPFLYARKFSEEHMDAVEAVVNHVRAASQKP